MNYSTKTKIKLWLGSIISWLMFSVSVLLVFFMIVTGIMHRGYTYAWNRFLYNQVYEDAQKALYGYCWDYYNTIRRNEEFDTYYYDQLYSEENSNFRFTCVSEEGTAIPGYFNTEEKKQISDEYNFTLSFYENSDTHRYFYRDEDSMNDFLSSLKGEYSYEIEEEVTEGEEINYYVTVYRNIEQAYDVKMQVYIPSELKAGDEYYYVNHFFHLLNNWKLYIVGLMVVSAILMIVFTVMLIKRSGRKAGNEQLYLDQVDKIPFDILICILGVILILIVYVAHIFMFDYPDNLLYCIIYILLICGELVVLGMILLEFVLTTAVRIKAGQLFSNTVIYKSVSFFVDICKKTWHALIKIGSYKKTALIFFVLDALLLFLYIYADYYVSFYDERYIFFILYFAIMAVLFCFEITVIFNVYLLQTSCRRIAEGDLDYKINNKLLLKYFSDVSDSINSISEGMNRALREQIKSEHFKTELITNVSHDIKTPLTSIITYVNLLQQSGVTGEDATEYLDVLERQSGKLKKLIEDLVEASKASTGNLNLDYSVMDIGLLVEQAAGEYEGRFSDINLNVVMNMKPETYYISADGRYLWRVIDNLLSNICKYSLENTRVYIAVEKNIEGKCLITFKNISKYEIKITPEELTERFVRGDKSRNTDGSGLGLSIARSLTEAMGGRLYIEVDGDLYKAVLVFDSVK